MKRVEAPVFRLVWPDEVTTTPFAYGAVAGGGVATTAGPRGANPGRGRGPPECTADQVEDARCQFLAADQCDLKDDYKTKCPRLCKVCTGTTSTTTLTTTTPTTVTAIGATGGQPSVRKKMDWNFGVPWQDPGFFIAVEGKETAEDQAFLRTQTAITGTVQVFVEPGPHTLTYSYTDTDGQTGTATRVVTIVDNLPPNITLLGGDVVDLASGDTFADPGIQWADLYDMRNDPWAVNTVTKFDASTQPAGRDAVENVLRNPRNMAAGTTYRLGTKNIDSEKVGDYSVV